MDSATGSLSLGGDDGGESGCRMVVAIKVTVDWKVAGALKMGYWPVAATTVVALMPSRLALGR